MPPNLSLGKDADLRRIDHQLSLLRQLDRFPRALDAAGNMDGMDVFQRQAMEMLANPATRNAFDLSQEPVALRERYGNTRVGQEAILGRGRRPVYFGQFLAQSGLGHTFKRLPDAQGNTVTGV